MSDLLICGMEKPKTGRYFVAVDNTDGKDKIVISVMSEFERGDKTRPLLAVHEAVPVPPHGRLGDLDKMKESIRKQTAFLRILGGEFAEIAETLEKGFLQEIDNAPTVIPAEEE